MAEPNPRHAAEACRCTRCQSVGVAVRRSQGQEQAADPLQRQKEHCAPSPSLKQLLFLAAFSWCGVPSGWAACCDPAPGS